MSELLKSTTEDPLLPTFPSSSWKNELQKRDKNSLVISNNVEESRPNLVIYLSEGREITILNEIGVLISLFLFPDVEESCLNINSHEAERTICSLSCVSQDFSNFFNSNPLWKRICFRVFTGSSLVREMKSDSHSWKDCFKYFKDFHANVSPYEIYYELSLSSYALLLCIDNLDERPNHLQSVIIYLINITNQWERKEKMIEPYTHNLPNFLLRLCQTFTLNLKQNYFQNTVTSESDIIKNTAHSWDLLQQFIKILNVAVRPLEKIFKRLTEDNLPSIKEISYNAYQKEIFENYKVQDLILCGNEDVPQMKTVKSLIDYYKSYSSLPAYAEIPSIHPPHFVYLQPQDSDKLIRCEFELLKGITTIESLLPLMGCKVEDQNYTINLPLIVPVNLKETLKVLEFCHLRKDITTRIKDDIEIQKKYEDWISQLDQAALFEMILASNTLGFKCLLDATCRCVANLIKGKTPEEIRQTFNIKNDFTPEEEEKVRQENNWCEETTTEPPFIQQQPTTTASPLLLQELLNMSFTEEQASEALIITQNISLDAAIDYIFQHPIQREQPLSQLQPEISGLTTEPGVRTADPLKVQQLIEMGFTQLTAEAALIKTDNDLSDAVQLLMN